MLQVHALDEIHGDEFRRTIFANVEYADDILMDDRLGKQDLLLEAFQRQRRAGNFREKGLECNDSA
jgi:hypothetical protein